MSSDRSPLRNPELSSLLVHAVPASSEESRMSSLQKPLLLDLIAPFKFPRPGRPSDTRPCLRFLGVVMNTHQSPIWIERWTAAPGAMPPCLGPFGPQKTFGTPTVSKSCGTVPPRRVSAVTVHWLAGACTWSSPCRAHGRGVSSIDQTAPVRGSMCRMKERPISPAGFSPRPRPGSLLHPESMASSYPKTLCASKGFWSRRMQ